ncbi:MAG TPA: hypothetical protein VF453_12205, partial [Burkholderiaceae bacterium]
MFSFFRKKTDPAASPAGPAAEPPPAPSAPLEFLKRVFTGAPAPAAGVVEPVPEAVEAPPAAAP